MLFAEAFSGEKHSFNYNNIGVAIGAFECTLLTRSCFDGFLNGDEDALNKSDKKAFKVPSLRNIAQTGPYIHDGSVEILDEAIELMAKHQLGRDVGHGFVKHVKAFLGSLTGKEAP